MEGMLQSGQEDYIWAMRNTAYQDSEEEAWLERHSFTSDAPNRQLRKRSKARSLSTDPQSTVLASLVPDEVIYNVNDYSHRHYDACFLFGDVSGFTELADKYNRPGAAGPSRLTQVLNHYLGAMVQEIMSHQGDVLKFSGDAFLAMWKCTENTSMRDAVHQVLDCALLIQKAYGSYQTDVGVVIRVKLAISAGAVIFALIGDETSSHYVVVGKPIWDVKSAEALSVAGDVIVAPAAFHFTNPNEYLSQEMNDGMHVKVLGLGPNWRSTQKSLRHQNLQRANSEESLESNEDDHSVTNNSNSTTARLSEPPTEEFSLRPAVNAAIRLNIKQDLRKFIIKPVIKSVDMNQPFEYLTEMRQVAVMFINIKSKSFEITATLALAHESYKIVCKVCEELKGCVNKVSFFDKDLMMVVIFGLRGLKQELESRMALKCATDCQHSIAKLKQVLNVSIGVTTGKTYCGVFGHTLRREYTVISLTVNKAARIMCAYKGKVTCDRETFLHSKLEAKHFILQEYKTLKGISNPGPIYEFKEVPVDHAAQQKIPFFPLLGRDEELKMYTKLLGEYLSPPQSNTYWNDPKMFLIQGDARQGKTRLLEECIFSTHVKIPVSRLTLTQKDTKIPYQALKLMFMLPLGLSSDSSTQEREERLLIALRQMKVPELMCCLNHMFGVKFRMTVLYSSMDEKTKRLIEHKMMKQVCAGCLLVPWLFTVDDADYIDDATWELMTVLLDVKKIFFVATISRNKIQNQTATKLMSDHRVKVVELKSIDRWFHGGLACQILNVYALPAELEKVIQAKSNGNPGWIESYLISLIQADGLFIVSIDFKRIKELGLVCPPLYMMIRMNSAEETIEWKHEMEERSLSFSQKSTHDFWKVYVDSCRGSYQDIVVREELEKRFRRKSIQPVCMIKRDFNIADVDPEVSMDVMILKTFDSLSSYEQLIIKVSAILGNQFSRDMLMFVMSSAQIREAALAIKTLFEIKVLSCAKGDFLESGNMVFKERLLNPNNDVQLKCLCRGIKVDESCRDLPRYASCGYMQFRSSMFRDITYNLLTDNQKKEFHFRAIRYLEKETRKCRSCGNGFFDRILGIKREEHFLERKRRRPREDNNSANEDNSVSISRRSSLHSSPSTSLSNKTLDTSQSISSGASTSGVFDKKHSVFKSIWGFRHISKLKNSYSLTKAFSSEDFTDCQCALILMTTYAQLMEHCKGAQNWPKLVDTMLEYSNVCINSNNVSLAMLVLEESLLLITHPNRSTSDIYWRRDMQKGKSYSLLGYCRMEMGQSQEALKCLNSSLAAYGFKFPRNSCRKSLKTYGYELKQLFGFFVLPGTLVNTNLDHWQTLFCNYVSECLAFLCLSYMNKEAWEDAELAASWSLNHALRAFSDFQIICTAYSNMMMVAQHFAKSKLCLALEIHSLQLCHMKKESVDAEELKAVAKLYSVIFRNRVDRSEVRKAIQIAYIVLRIGSSLHTAKIILPVIASMLRSLLLGKHLSGALSMLHDLDYFAEEDIDRSARVWYYALAMTFHLETGFTVVRYQDCEKYYQMEGDYLVVLRDPDALKRFHAMMWLWCVRNDKWESAGLWSHKAPEIFELKPYDTPTNNFTALHVLEGMIIYLVCKMNRRNPQGILKAKNKIEPFMVALEKTTKRASVLLPRFYHLQAYYRFVVYNDKKAFALMQKGCKLAKNLENFLELSWMEHSKKAWTRNMPTLVRDFWRDHCEPDNALDYHEIDVNSGKIGFFTLPIPMYL